MSKKLRKQIGKNGDLPRHIAIIMDGNGRWAKSHSFQRIAGHKEGINSVREIVRVCGEIGVQHLTLYTFSSENWTRPESEVSSIMNLLFSTIRKEIDNLHKNNVRLSTIGKLDDLPIKSYKEIIEGINNLDKDSVLLILGKGHEKIQEFESSSIKFSDQDVVNKYIRENS